MGAQIGRGELSKLCGGAVEFYKANGHFLQV